MRVNAGACRMQIKTSSAYIFGVMVWGWEINVFGITRLLVVYLVSN